MDRVLALLFDLDGTLADTGSANFAAYAQALGEAGVTVDRSTFDAVAHGRNWRQFLPELLERAGSRADPFCIARRKQECYPELLGGLRLNQPLLALALTAHSSLATALVTTASGASVRAILRQHQLGELFDVVITGDDVVEHKPNPEAYLAATSRLGVAPANCLAFEDSAIGVAAAEGAGIRVVRIVL